MKNDGKRSFTKKSFEWDEYLKFYGGEPAPPTCFRQALVQPQNEFKARQKVVTVEPCNRWYMCIATIIDAHGPYILLRHDGTDNRNDFWRLVDSEFIRPFDYRMKNDIQPPLAYRGDLSTWPGFLDQILQSANEKTFAPATCFKRPPPKPPKNSFKIGHKIEAVDTTDPNLLCPATVVDVDNDFILISFDGWSQTWNVWRNYASRDIFPIGWCKRAGYILQRPGNNNQQIIANMRRLANLPDRSNTSSIYTPSNNPFNNLQQNNCTNVNSHSTPDVPATLQSASAVGIDLSIVKSESIDQSLDNNLQKNGIKTIRVQKNAISENNLKRPLSNTESIHTTQRKLFKIENNT